MTTLLLVSPGPFKIFLGPILKNHCFKLNLFLPEDYLCRAYGLPIKQSFMVNKMQLNQTLKYVHPIKFIRILTLLVFSKLEKDPERVMKLPLNKILG